MAERPPEILIGDEGETVFVLRDLAETETAARAYVEANGWGREEPGSGWWLHEKFGEETIGFAVEAQLDEDGVDTRQPPPAPVAAAETEASG